MKVTSKTKLLLVFMVLLIVFCFQNYFKKCWLIGSVFTRNSSAFSEVHIKSTKGVGDEHGSQMNGAVFDRKSDSEKENPTGQNGGQNAELRVSHAISNTTTLKENLKIAKKQQKVAAFLPNSFTQKVVYNVDVLLKEIQRIHDSLYTKPLEETCKVRPAGCVIIGVAKSGTQELRNFLSLHPHVVQKHNLPNPNLFDLDSHLARGKEKMPCTYSDQIGVVKTDYFFFREDMPAKFYKFNSRLKMILLVREPVERLISAYSFSYLQKKQHRLVFNYKINDIPEIDSAFVDQQNESIKTNQFDIEHSVYDSAMERYLKYFPRHQILVIDSNEFKKDPVTVLQRVEEFLGLKPVITSDYFVYNKSKHFHCLKTNAQTVCYGSDRGRAQLKDIKPETRRKLHDYFRPHNERFFEQIGKRFNWTMI